jgi:hypothetical protein
MAARKDTKRGGRGRVSGSTRANKQGASTRSKAIPEKSVVPSKPLRQPRDPASVASSSLRANRRPPAIQRPIALVVVGMHRSGTSALGYCLSRLGAGLPLHLVGAGSANELGHWEPEKIIALNDKYLAAVGSGWDDWRQFDHRTMAPHVKSAFVREIKATVRAEYSGQNLLMLKDPRISRMIPLYDSALRDAGYDPRYIVCMRSPAETVGSLADRDGMSEAYARLLWLRHMLDAEHSTRGLPRTIHQFDALLGDWRESLEMIGDDLALAWPRSLNEAEAEITGFLDRGLRHHWRGEESFVGPYADWLMRAWEGLHEAGTRRGQSKLDAVRDEFNELCAEIGDQVVAEVYSRHEQVQSEIALHRDNAERLAGMLREEVARAERAEKFLGEANARVESAEGRILQHVEEAALHRGHAVDMAERLHAAVERIQQLDELNAAKTLDMNMHLENAERLAGMLREEVARAERAEKCLGEANARVESAEGRILQHVEEAAQHRGHAVDMAERLHAAVERIQQLDELNVQKTLEKQKSESLRMRLEAEHADLAERYTRLDRDHIGLAERYGKVVAEYGALTERHLGLEADHRTTVHRLHEVDAQVNHLGQVVASQADLGAELAAREEEFQQVALRVAALELELRLAYERQIKAADEYDRRLHEMVVRFADQAGEGVRASERHAAERVSLLDRLIFAERETARLAALAEHNQRLLAGSEAVVRACEIDLALERERSGSLSRDVELTRQELMVLRDAGAAAAVAIDEAVRREAELNDQIAGLGSAYEAAERQVRLAEDRSVDLDAALRAIADDREQLQRAVADRAAERDAAYDRLREARAEKEALISQMGVILLNPQSQPAPAANSSELEALRNHVAAMRNSTSWKVSAPLRVVSRLLGRGRK